MKKNQERHVINQYQEQNSGYVLFNGLSVLNDQPIIAVLTTKSANDKTGNIAQITYIPLNDYSKEKGNLRLEVKQAVCKGCPLLMDENGKPNGCYVNPMGTASIKRAFLNGNYKDISNDKKEIQAILSKYIVRNGQDGDPLSIPFNLVNLISQFSMVHLSYSHLWRDNPDQAGNHMASVQSIEEAEEAQSLGFKTYRIRKNKSDPIMDNEIVCPFENDPSKQCFICQLCDGSKANVVNTAHGTTAHKITFFK